MESGPLAVKKSYCFAHGFTLELPTSPDSKEARVAQAILDGSAHDSTAPDGIG